MLYHVGERSINMDIKALRKQLGMTQEELAQKLGVSWSTVQRWESNKGRPSNLALQRLEQLKPKLKREK
jgi:putative transcriptional regulator